MGKTERCPRCGFVIMQTDEACLPSAPGSVKSDKPDPQADGEMKETIRCPKCDKELFTDGSYLSIAPHRRTSKELEPRISQLEADSKRHETNQIGFEKECIDFQRKVEEIERCCSPALGVRCSGPVDAQIRGLERKVEEVRNDFYATQSIKKLNEEAKPQPAVAYAWDKDQKVKHELIPGVSVVEFAEEPTAALFLGTEPDNPKAAIIFRGNNTNGIYGHYGWCVNLNDLVWLRDLPIPGGGK